MTMAPFLPWFPIILAVGVGGRLLGRTRAVMMAGMCAVFWIALAVASMEPARWTDPLNVAALVAGCAAILAMGAWSGEQADATATADKAPAARASTSRPAAPPAGGAALELSPLTDVIEQFDDWLDTHRDHADPWPKFDEFLRQALFSTCHATHVRPYRVLSEGDELLPLGDVDRHDRHLAPSTRQGVVGHVVTTGRSYLATDPAQGELLRQLADQSPGPNCGMDWCFAISQGNRRIGVVSVGQVFRGPGPAVAPARQRAFLRLVERTVSLCWSMLSETCRSRSAELDDPVSKLLIREAFLRTGQQTLKESYRSGEPIALAVVALERLRQLNDTGRWELADELVREVSVQLRDKVRSDDLLGRFDGSRFLVLLRRVDSELAALILNQMLSRLKTLCGDSGRWKTAIEVRCGVVGSGMEQPDLRTLISSAVAQCHRARESGVMLASDMCVSQPA